MADYRKKLKESEKKDKYLDLTRKQKKTEEHKSDVYTNYNWCSWYSHQRTNKGTKGLGNKRMSRDHLNYCIIEISQNTGKSPENLKCLVIQTPVKDHTLKLIWKTFFVLLFLSLGQFCCFCYYPTVYQLYLV